MVFSSSIFLFLFLPIIATAYFLIALPLRNLFLLTASLFFYAWGETGYVLLMLVSVFVNYGFGIWIDSSRSAVSRKLILAFAVTANLSGLAFFKYAGFLVSNLNTVLIGLNLSPIEMQPVHLPIGISFFTFQAMSYVIDVYRDEAPVQKNPINIALYIALFPQLIAGPIVRYHDVAQQLLKRTVDLDGVSYGIRRFVFGLSKKILIANAMGRVADDVFALPNDELSMGVAWLGIIAYSLQIYFDFSGYSDMAIGLGRIFGFRFLENFNYPYISQSITEFWRRWHISLSSWYRDYLYIPLGGNRKGTLRTYFNLVTVFFLCGLWHGASWNFVIWGLYHGGFLVIERMGFGDMIGRTWRPLRHVYVIIVFMVGWVFFRAETLTQSLAYIAAMFGLHAAPSPSTTIWFLMANDDWLALLAGVAVSVPILPALVATQNRRMESAASTAKASLQVGAVVSLIILFTACSLRLAAGTHNPFIYFRF